MNMTSQSKKTLQSVSDALDICRVLEEYVIGNISKLQQSSKYPETLNFTEDQQYRSRGLLHIEDSIYEFFLEVEVLRVENLNNSKLKEKKEQLIDDAIFNVAHNISLTKKWESCFHANEFDQEIIKTLFGVLVERYMKAGAGQYIKDFRTSHRLKKISEHRKKVLERKTALEEKQFAMPYKDILDDVSVGKVSTHLRLQGYIEKFGNAAFLKYFKKDQLIKLCKAYGITSINKRSTKTNLGEKLIPSMNSCDCMPYPYFLYNLQSQPHIDEENRRVSLTIRRVACT